MKAKHVSIILLAAFVYINVNAISYRVNYAAAAGPEMEQIRVMVENKDEQYALDLIMQTAKEIGGWEPAPGDNVVFDSYMSRNIRGSVLDYDEPAHCSDVRVSPDPQACIDDFQRVETQVRFGPSLFSTPQPDGNATLRPEFSDLLSTYIEEVGHSWQEYLYETKGTGNGPRQHTTKAESEHWAAGREYQIKRYILSLDGTLLTLSDQQRSNLMTQICEGYANPVGHEVPAYSSPPGWANPEGWPVSQPTSEELATFCAQISGLHHNMPDSHY